MADFARDEQSAHDHELVLDDELIQDQDSALRPERSRRTRVRGERFDELPSIRRAQLRVGEVLAGKYRVERVHQQGTLGVTVEAEHLQLGQRVALKLMLADPNGYPEAAARFLRGARFAVQLRNEHVARVVDVGTLESGAPYMVTEHLSGSDLRAVLRVREWLPVPEAVDYVLQACAALAEAHVMGFVHRNLKPSNLFLTRRDDSRPIVKVLDFCVSEGPLGETALSVSTSSSVVSSLAYLAPEQIRDPGAVDLRADVWALGAVLHELLTGMPLYAASTAPGLFAMIAADSPTPVSHLRREIPAELESVVLRCLEKEREDRFQDVGDLARQLKPFASTDGRDSVERVVLHLERRARSGRSTRPPALPGATEQRSIVRVSAVPAAPSGAVDIRRRLVEIAVIAVCIIGCSVSVGALVAVRNLRTALAARPPLERAVIASLSPALTASAAVQSSAAPNASQVHVALGTPATVATLKPRPRQQKEPRAVISDAPPKSATTAEPSEPGIVADAKPPQASAPHAHGLFDDAN
jgi:eukaryotic-like serine/threonine-protein kinase